MAAKPHTTKRVVLQLPTVLVDQVDAELRARGSSLEEYVRLQLTAFKRSKTGILLSDTMPMGKYAGEPVEEIARADPGYLIWLAGLDGNENKFTDQVIAACIQAQEARPNGSDQGVSGGRRRLVDDARQVERADR